jgi:hypothetical protein
MLMSMVMNTIIGQYACVLRVMVCRESTLVRLQKHLLNMYVLQMVVVYRD